MKANKYKQIKKTENIIQDILDNDKDTITNDYHLMHLEPDVTKNKLFWRYDLVGGGNKRIYLTDVDMYYKILEYFALNNETRRIVKDRKGVEVEVKEPMTYLDLLHYLQLTRTTSLAYANGEYDENGIAYSTLLAWAREVIENDNHKGGLTGAYNERIVLATLQSKYNWTIETKLSVQHDVQLTADEATKELFLLLKEAKGALQAVSDNIIDVE